MRRIVVEVPATVANCGPGFDAVGVAIDLVTRVEVTIEDDAPGIEVAYEGPWASALADAPNDETNLLARAFLEIAGGDAPKGIRFLEHVDAPVGRGFGSSASAIVGGILAASGLGYGVGADGEAGLAAAIDIEGHPDNVVPCFLGGITISAGTSHLRFDPPAGWMMLLAVAPHVSSTLETRATLPATYLREAVAQQSGRAALLGAALAVGEMGALYDATADMLHQPARFAAMPDSARIVETWRAQHLPAFLSGGGPSVAAFIEAAEAADIVARAEQDVPDGWRVLAVDLRPEGARLIR
jgi:homoserine kinase